MISTIINETGMELSFLH